MGNIITGIIFIIGGLSGYLVLIGTNSNEAIVVVGIGLVIWGFIKMGNKPSDKLAEASKIDGQEKQVTQEKVDPQTCFHCAQPVTENPYPHCGKGIYG